MRWKEFVVWKFGKSHGISSEKISGHPARFIKLKQFMWIDELKNLCMDEIL
jgi:hypothetical protein